MQRPTRPAPRAIFIATIFLSALLLFSVQPMFAKMVLPTLGGAPAVWAVSLCFFQVVLLTGYCYAHLLHRYLPPQPALLVHLAVLLAALLALPVRPPVVAAETPTQDTYVWLAGILTAGVGLPFFALSANAPLLQAWFSRSGHAESADAYFLYAASNSGSLAALIAYPFLIEPMLSLGLQSRVWMVLYVLLGGLIAACGSIMLRAYARASPEAEPTAIPGPAPAEAPWLERLWWAGLAFVPSGLLVALTTFVTTDIASVPLFWVVPLGLYLGTFIVVFRQDPPVGRRALLVLQPVAIAVTIATMDWDATFAWAVSCLACILAFVVTGLICHRRLYENRPAAERLTEFYLWISIGGAAGGIFAALLAPQIFTNLLELPLLLGLGMLARIGWQDPESLASRRPAALTLAAAIGGALLLTLLLAHAPISWTPNIRIYLLAALGIAMVLSWRWTPIQLGATAAVVLGATLLPNGNTPVHVVRSFFGTHRVVDPPGDRFRLLLHGTTLHGAQRLDDLRRTGPGHPMPIIYYHSSGPLARSPGLARNGAAGLPPPLRFGVIGLGTGAMACHSRQGDRVRFFEIDPEVAKIATDARLFTFLSSCQPGAEIVLGDARLTLAREAPGSFDYLLVDAFSSDAIPLHLLTVEALRLYARLLSPRGVLTLHVSNQHLDLPPIVESNLARVPELSGIYVEGESGKGAIRSQVILIARDNRIIEPALAWHKARRLDKPSVAPWTDDYSDVLSPLIRRYRARLLAREAGDGSR